MRKIAVTGGLASGKSTVCRFFGELGAYVISADDIVHKLLSYQTDLGKKIVDLCGKDVVVDFELDRDKLVQKVFSNDCLLQQLEQLLHPEVQKVIEAHYHRISHDNYPLFIAEIPLLFEQKVEDWKQFFDATVAVVADLKICEKRFIEKGGSAQGFALRHNRQLPMKEKRARANYVLHNNGDLKKLKSAVMKIYEQLTLSE